MEYWEFLLQQEGSRSWQPLKSQKIAVEPGRYRVVAHSNRINTDVEICVTHTSTAENPPKRRSQKRSRRTNSEGLMVVIPFTYLKPGVWELRCCGDIMSDFLGKSWQQAIQLQILPTAAVPVVETTPNTVKVDQQKDIFTATEPATIETETPLEPVLAVSPKPEISANQINNTIEIKADPEAVEPEVIVQNQRNEPPLPVTLVEVETLNPVTFAELDAEKTVISDRSTEAATPSNPILEQSLQMLEQILQQVLDPVLQELDAPEPSESPIAEPEATTTLAPVLEWQGITLTLEADAHTTRRKEALSIAGVVDVLDVNPSNGIKTKDTANSVFQGSLRYQLRDPQSSQLLLDVQHPLPEQELPITFSHSLEIPAECKTRLILGKITLHSSTGVALTSQPFTITADLDELLESIIPGTKVMPVAKMLVLANNFAALEDNQGFGQLADTDLEPVVLDLIDTHKPPSRTLEPATQKPLPPQIYQPTPTPKGSKSLQLPSFPKMPAPTTNVEETTEEVKPEEAAPVAIADDTAEEVSLNTLEDSSSSQPEVEAAAEAIDSDELSVLFVSVDESQIDTSEVLKEAAEITSATNSEVSNLAAIELWDTPKAEISTVEVTSTESPAEAPAAVDSAFQALNIQDRFWLRLNLLAADAELSQWLQSDLSPSRQSVVEETQLQPKMLITEVEEVTPSINSDFDALIWAETDEFGRATPVTKEEQPLHPPTESTSGEDAIPAQLPLVGVSEQDWAAQEIVVDDDEFLVPLVPEQPLAEPEVKQAPRENFKPLKPLSSLPKVTTPKPVQFESPLPAPVLVVPTHELAVGEPVTVRIKLPPHAGRLCVKLWVQDRQSRSLLDGPRWLVDLLPDGAGHLEAMTQLVVPYGCAEIRFEAIAIDLDSQRESHKVSLDCVVMPPDLPSMSMDEFET